MACEKSLQRSTAREQETNILSAMNEDPLLLSVTHETKGLNADELSRWFS